MGIKLKKRGRAAALTTLAAIALALGPQAFAANLSAEDGRDFVGTWT